MKKTIGLLALATILACSAEEKEAKEMQSWKFAAMSSIAEIHDQAPNARNYKTLLQKMGLNDALRAKERQAKEDIKLQAVAVGKALELLKTLEKTLAEQNQHNAQSQKEHEEILKKYRAENEKLSQMNKALADAKEGKQPKLPTTVWPVPATILAYKEILKKSDQELNEFFQIKKLAPSKAASRIAKITKASGKSVRFQKLIKGGFWASIVTEAGLQTYHLFLDDSITGNESMDESIKPEGPNIRIRPQTKTKDGSELFESESVKKKSEDKQAPIKKEESAPLEEPVK